MIDKTGLFGSELALAETLDDCLKEGAIHVALKALSIAGDAFPLRDKYLRAIGDMVVPPSAKPAEPLSAMEETVSLDSLN